MSFQDQRFDFNSFSIEEQNYIMHDKNQEIMPWSDSNTNILKQFNCSDNQVKLNHKQFQGGQKLNSLYQKNIISKSERNLQLLNSKQQFTLEKESVKPLELQFQMIKKTINYIEPIKQNNQKSLSLKFQIKPQDSNLQPMSDNLLFNKELSRIKNQSTTSRNSFRIYKIQSNQVNFTERIKNISPQKDFDYEEFLQLQIKQQQNQKKKKQLLNIDYTNHPLAQQQGWIPTQTRNILKKNHELINQFSKKKYIYITKSQI